MRWYAPGQGLCSLLKLYPCARTGVKALRGIVAHDDGFHALSVAHLEPEFRRVAWCRRCRAGARAAHLKFMEGTGEDFSRCTGSTHDGKRCS